ncbi:MAG: DUF6660 family protein [Flavobacteriales bacterium]
MKVILFLFSIYFLSLHMIPCNDANVESHDAVARVEADGDLEDHKNHDPKDQCSPFCPCNCCSVHVITYEFQILDFQHIPEIKTKISSYNNPLYDGYNDSILQPPRLNS